MGKSIIKLILTPILVTVIGGVAVFLIQRVIEQQTKPAILVSSQGGSLVLTNSSDEVLSVGVAYRAVEGGTSTYCYPNPTTDESGPVDPQLWPGDTQTFGPRHCNAVAANGYDIWAWNARRDLVFETEG